MRRLPRQSRTLLAALCVAVMTAACSERPSAPAAPAVEWRTVVKIFDGDTVLLDGDEKVRLLGVDTPEAHDSDKLDRVAKRTGMTKAAIMSLGREASAFTGALCLNRRVRLEYGPERTDAYGRTLAIVRLEDGRSVNEEILAQGYGAAYRAFDYPHKGRYLELESAARAGMRGLWAKGMPVQY